MKNIISVILILAFLSFQLSESLIYLSFKINQDFIAKTLCVEKDVENSSCMGCCQLKKKLADQNEQKEQLPPTQNSKNNIDLFTSEGIVLTFFPNQISSRKSIESQLYSNPNLFRVFHPPKAISV